MCLLIVRAEVRRRSNPFVLDTIDVVEGVLGNRDNQIGDLQRFETIMD